MPDILLIRHGTRDSTNDLPDERQPLSPKGNPFVERVIGSVRRECLDHVIVWNERALRHHLQHYLAYYNGWRTHLSLDKDAPSRGLCGHRRAAGSFKFRISAACIITTNAAPPENRCRATDRWTP